MNGRYYGLYLLCKQIRVGENRIDIDELTADDTEEPEITDGYFLSAEPYDKDPEEGKFTTKRGVNFYINDPGYEEADDEGTAAHKAYISRYVQDTEDAIFGDDFKDENGRSYREYLDISSTIDYWWMQEFSTNRDAYKTPSTYLYKKGTENCTGDLSGILIQKPGATCSTLRICMKSIVFSSQVRNRGGCPS